VMTGHESNQPGIEPSFISAFDEFPEHVRIGVPRDFFFDDLHPEIAAAVEHAIQVFAGLGAEIRDVKLDVSTDRTLASAEAYAYHKPFVEKSPQLYQPATLARIQAGANISAADVQRATRELETSREAIRKVFEEVNVLLTPTVPIPPPLIEDLRNNPDDLRPQELIMLRNTRPFNVWGIPAISIPCGFMKNGLPIGLQIAAAARDGIGLLQAAQAYEQATEWHKEMPTLAQST